MGRRIEYPQLPKGQPAEQLQALYNYLYQMAEALNNNLSEIGNGDFTDDEMVVVKEIVGETGTADGGMAEAETLKSLIIKTAQLIKSEIDAYNLKLIGTYEAEGKLGKYVRNTRLDVDVTPSGIQQNYTFKEIIQGLKTYEVNAKNYIKTGYLRTENSIPIYGVAIGKDVVTFSEDGTETYNDENKVAELTADELSFWQNSNKVAGYTGTDITLYCGNSKRLVIDSDGMSIYKGNTLLAKFTANGTELYQNGNMIAKYAGTKISFYSNGTEIFYIENGNLYSAGDLELGSSKKVKIGNWEFDAKGATFEDTASAAGFPFRISTEDNKLNEGVGIAFDDNSGNFDEAKIRFYFKKAAWNATCGIDITAYEVGTQSQISVLAAKLMPKIYGNGYIDLGDEDHEFGTGYFYALYLSSGVHAETINATRAIFSPKFYGGRCWDNTDLQSNDLDNVAKPGHYYRNTTYTLHHPTGLSGDYELDVSTGGTSTSDIIQKIYAITDIYMRRKPYGGSWGSWYKFAGTAV